MPSAAQRCNLLWRSMIMHIDNNPGKDSRRNIGKALMKARGVIHVHSSDHRPHRVLVSHDTDYTLSFEILAQLADQRPGVERVAWPDTI